MTESTTPAAEPATEGGEIFAVGYLAEDAEHEGDRDAVRLTGATITRKPRELERKLRERAVTESEELRERASKGGVRVVLVELHRLEADPIRGRSDFVLE